MNLGAMWDLLFPRSCVGCGRADPDGGTHVCWNCLAAVSLIQPPLCDVCGEPVSGRIEHSYVCSECSSRRRYFDRARSAALYDGLVREMLLALKYRGAVWLARDLGRLLRECAAVHFDPDEVDAVTCVPLYPARRRERGFNQAAVLAGYVARAWRKPLLGRTLARVRPTPTQTRLTASERLTNVRNAFGVRRASWVKGLRLLLVDDVLTTGSTVNECARVLKEAGAARVYVVTVARGS